MGNKWVRYTQFASMIVNSNSPVLNRVYFENTLVLLGPGSRGNFGVFLPGGAYKSKTPLFSGAASFHLPTASPLKASTIFLVKMFSFEFYHSTEGLQQGSRMVVGNRDLCQDGG